MGDNINCGEDGCLDNSLKMKFNPGLKKYEPELPLIHKKSKSNISYQIEFWKVLSIIILIAIGIGFFMYLVVKSGV